VQVEKLARRASKVMAAQEAFAPGHRFWGNHTQDAVQAQTGDDVQLAAKVTVFDSTGRVLLLHDAAADRWDLPGGYLQEGESPEAGAEREVREETGLSVKVTGGGVKQAKYGDRTHPVLTYEAHVGGARPQVTLSQEHDRHEWVKAGDAGLYLVGAFAGFVPQEGAGHADIHDEAAETMRGAVHKVVSRAEQDALEGKQEDEFLEWALAVLALAAAHGYGRACERTAKLERGEDHGDKATEAEEQAFGESRKEPLRQFVKDVQTEFTTEAKRGRELKETPKELAKRLGDLARRVEKARGDTVAHTEAHAAYGKAQFKALVKAGRKTALWKTKGDDRVRESHVECEEAGPVKLGQPFPNGLLYPGDPSGPPEEIINCRCQLIGAGRNV
jgi:8-oxo-dGTP pyrophosphatase MutT (NUDIX family)